VAAHRAPRPPAYGLHRPQEGKTRPHRRGTTASRQHTAPLNLLRTVHTIRKRERRSSTAVAQQPLGWFVLFFVWFLRFFLFWPLGGNTPWPACCGSTPRPSTSCERFTPSAGGKSTAALPMHLIRRVRSTLRAAGVLQRRLKLVLFRRVFVVFVFFSFNIVPLQHAILPPAYSLHHPQEEKKTQHNNHLLFLLLFLSAFFVFSFLSCFCSLFFLVRCRFPLPLSAATPGRQHYPSTFEG